MDPRFAALADDLQRVFDARLLSLVAYGNPNHDEGVHTLALVLQLTFQDLAACAPQTAAWRRNGLAVPLILSRHEFVRSLDAFPVEYGAIIADHQVIVGTDPFVGVQVSESDLRRACEQHVKSHVIHLREGFLESGGDPKAVARLMAASAPALRALHAHLERLDPGIDQRAGLTDSLEREVGGADATTIADPTALYTRYLETLERLWQEVDRWRG